VACAGRFYENVLFVIFVTSAVREYSVVNLVGIAFPILPLGRADEVIRVSAPAASWCDPAGASPAQVRSSVRLVASVTWPLATAAAKRTQRLHGVWD
jgi:hypothetical protein